MNVSIDFPADIETALKREATAKGLDVASFVQEIVTERLQVDRADQQAQPSQEEFRSKLRSIIDLHPRSLGEVDDSRESIYSGRDA